MRPILQGAGKTRLTKAYSDVGEAGLIPGKPTAPQDSKLGGR